jgi:hypothetical protein
MKRRPKSARAARTKARELTALLHRLVSVSQSPERLIELYYWSLEPELAEVMRHYITLPNEPRSALRAFLAMTADCAESVRVAVISDGQVTLSSPVVSKLMMAMAMRPVPDDESESVH